MSQAPRSKLKLKIKIINKLRFYQAMSVENISLHFIQVSVFDYDLFSFYWISFKKMLVSQNMCLIMKIVNNLFIANISERNYGFETSLLNQL